MSFSFHEGSPEGLTSNLDPGIFHDANHLRLQSSSNWHSFYIEHGGKIEGLVHFNFENNNALSPVRSPFGSYLFSDAVSETVILDFVTFCEGQLINKKIQSITLKNQPEIYAPLKNQLLQNALVRLGYEITREETSAVISVSAEPFDSGLHKSEKKRLRKCRENGLLFELIPAEQLQKIYIFLEACRKEKGYALSMAYEEIEKLAKTFPERIMLTAVIDKNQLVAANISIRVYDHVLYNFYHDHSAEYDSMSPVVLLNEGLYQFCQRHNIQLLDLGTSNIDQELNESLLNFKLNLGAQPSRKLTFTKKLS